MRLSRALVLLLALAPACAAEEDLEDLGPVTDGKGDVPEIRDRAVTINKRTSSGKPGTRTFRVTADADFRVELRHDVPDALTRIVVTSDATGARVVSEKSVQPTLVVAATPNPIEYRVRLENYSSSALPARLTIVPARATISPELAAAARKNLERVAKEIDYWHLDGYGLSGPIAERFLKAVELEYANEPDQLQARMTALASMVFFAAPEILPPAGGKLTPFHGLDMAQFEQLMHIEDAVFDTLVQRNGSVVGVRPFSVCETRYIIEQYVRPRRAYDGFEAYKAGYQAFAATCPQKDLDEWYNFRGLGHLRPSWVESNVMDRFLRRMNTRCAAPTPEWQAECARWNADRLAYRIEGNRELATRLLFYDPATQEAHFSDVYQPLVLLEDRDGDGIGEFLRSGPVQLASGASGTLEVVSTGEFTGSLKLRKPDGTLVNVKPQELVAESAVHPLFDAGLLTQPDLGLLAVFDDPAGCIADRPTPAACPLLERFYVLIDRHEYFYRTYSALSPDRSSISSQPSPLVACSITLAAAHAWDSAGIPQGGRAGFIFLMRIPFKQILAGSRKSVATLEPGPDVTTIPELYEGTDTLDLSRVWLDIASLSNNLYSHEHEISKFGAVPAEQIEGILVVRKPAAMP